MKNYGSMAVHSLDHQRRMEFLSIFLAELKKNNQETLDLNRFIEVVSKLQQVPKYASFLEAFSFADNEAWLNNIKELENWQFITDDSYYELNLPSLTQDVIKRISQNLPDGIDRADFYTFLFFLKELEVTSATEQEIKSKYAQVGTNKDPKTIHSYLKYLEQIKCIQNHPRYNISMDSTQIEKMERTSVQKRLELPMKDLIEYYNHPEKLSELKEEAQSAAIAKDIPKVEKTQEKAKELQFDAIKKRKKQQEIVTLDTTEDVLLSFFGFLQEKHMETFNSEVFERTMNETLQDPIYYAFPRHFHSFASKYFEQEIERVNINRLLNILVRRQYVQREGNFDFHLQLPRAILLPILNNLKEEDIRKLDLLSNKYLEIVHKMSK